MLKNEMLNNAMARLANIYKNDPAKLEAMNITAQIVLEAVKGQNALMEDGTTAATMTVNNLSGSQGKETVSSAHEVGNKYNNAGATDKLNSPKPDETALAGAMDVIRDWAKSEPVECRKWIEHVLNEDLDNAARIKYSNTSDNYKKAFDDEVSGTLEKDVKKLNEKIDAQQKKEGAKAAKQQEKAWKADQKAKEKQRKADERHQYHQNKLKEIDDAEETRKNEADKLSRAGINPEMYKDTKTPGMFGRLANKAKRWWHSIHEAAEQAIADGDMAKLESIKQQMLDFKELCEAAGLDFEQAIMD